MQSIILDSESFIFVSELFMDKILRYIVFCVVLLALWLCSAYVSVPTKMDGQCVAAHSASMSYHLESDHGVKCFMQVTTRDAEVAENTGRLHFLNSLRVQRLSVAQYLASLKSWVTHLSDWVASLSLHREKLFDLPPGLGGPQVCDYYVFMLRKILI